MKSALFSHHPAGNNSQGGVVSGMGVVRAVHYGSEWVGGSMQRGACSAGANFDLVTCRRLMRM